MLVLNTASPTTVLRAPNAGPRKTLPSSNASTPCPVSLSAMRESFTAFPGPGANEFHFFPARFRVASVFAVWVNTLSSVFSIAPAACGSIQ